MFYGPLIVLIGCYLTISIRLLAYTSGNGSSIGKDYNELPSGRLSSVGCENALGTEGRGRGSRNSRTSLASKRSALLFASRSAHRAKKSRSTSGRSNSMLITSPPATLSISNGSVAPFEDTQQSSKDETPQPTKAVKRCSKDLTATARCLSVESTNSSAVYKTSLRANCRRSTTFTSTTTASAAKISSASAEESRNESESPN